MQCNNSISRKCQKTPKNKRHTHTHTHNTVQLICILKDENMIAVAMENTHEIGFYDCHKNKFTDCVSHGMHASEKYGIKFVVFMFCVLSFAVCVCVCVCVTCCMCLCLYDNVCLYFVFCLTHKLERK